MELKDWIDLGRGRGKALAWFIKRAPSFVSNMAHGERQIPVVLMPAIEAFTRGQVTRQEMLPDGWRQQWPELCSDKPEDIWPELVDSSIKPETALAQIQTAGSSEALPTVAVPAGMALIPDRRVATEQRRAVDRERDIAQTGKGV